MTHEVAFEYKESFFNLELYQNYTSKMRCYVAMENW